MHDLREIDIYRFELNLSIFEDKSTKWIIVQDEWKIKSGGVFWCKLFRLCHCRRSTLGHIACSWVEIWWLWRSEKQNVVARSSAKAEFRAL